MKNNKKIYGIVCVLRKGLNRKNQINLKELTGQVLILAGFLL